MKNNYIKINIILVFIFLIGCKKDEKIIPEPYTGPGPTPYELVYPANFPQPLLPENNLLTNQGVALGRKLFYDPILSGDGTQACADCHNPSNAFVDPSTQFSTGIDGIPGTRNSMPLFNLAWNTYNRFFWDGRSIGLEAQAYLPVVDPIEMHNTWVQAVSDLQNHPTYPSLFDNAFETNIIDSVLVAKALAQFERTLVSGNAKFDKFLRGETALTASELHGFNLFMDENGGDCFHCHGSAANPLWTDNIFHNNGLDATFSDKGLGAVTGNASDDGKFKTPSLRNLSFTAPYMHDGRFTTIDEVLDHYSEGLVYSPTIDPLMKKVAQGGVQLTPSEKADLKAFLLTLDDYDFINNPAYQAPQ